MSAATLPRVATVGPLRRGLLVVLVASLVGLLGVSSWSFVWPSPGISREVTLGRVSDFVPGTVASFTVSPDGVQRLSAAGDYGARPPDHPGEGRSVVHLVRLPDGQLQAFSGADAIFGWTIVWYPLAHTPEVDDESAEVGRFAEPRRGSLWNIEGQRVFGPAPVALTPLDVEVLADDTVILDATPMYDGALNPRCLIETPSRSSSEGTLHVICDS